MARANFAAALVEGRLNTDATPPDLGQLAKRHGQPAGSDSLAFFSDLLCGPRLNPVSNRGPLNPSVALLLARPEAQLC